MELNVGCVSYSFVLEVMMHGTDIYDSPGINGIADLLSWICQVCQFSTVNRGL